ncbi:MAG: glycosyltransferase [Muribaculaceae bacterium]|nr:glycosyltransferase [Muribaculaceae bacterium]
MSIIIFAVTLLLVMSAIFYGLAPWRKVAAYETRTTGLEALPKISVVAYALRDEDDLEEYIDILLAQDYPDFEVILVCDASAEASAMISEKYENVSNLHVTFIPPGSHNLSRRKLAQTLGIKRASGDVVVTTSTSVKPRSDKWLRAMAEPFADSEINIACGYVHPTFADYKGPAKWYRQMDNVLTSAQWMASAIDGHPYRGDGYNLAFRRRLFFEVKGYSSSLTLVDGDDDIFITSISTGSDGVLVLNPDSFVDTQWESEANRMHVEYKDRYAFTRKYLPKAPFIRAASLAWAQWFSLAALIGIVMTALPEIFSLKAGASSEISSIVTLGLAMLCVIGFWLYEIMTYRRLASRLEAVRLFWGVIPFMLWRPVGNFIFFLNHYPSRKSHYTWIRH